MWVWLATLGVSVASAVLPIINLEIYLAGVAGASGVAGLGGGGALLFAVAAGLGQTVGKVIWYEVARRGVESAWAQKKLSGPKISRSYATWTARMEGRPWYAAAIIFLAASVGLPPLLVMSAVAGALRMRLWVFVPTVLLGRTLRFYLLLLGVDVALH